MLWSRPGTNEKSVSPRRMKAILVRESIMEGLNLVGATTYNTDSPP